MKKIKFFFQRGLLTVRFLKLFIYVKYILFYYFFGKKIGPYGNPPKDIKEIGFLDKERFVHVDNRHKKYFNERNIYRGGGYIKLKSNSISLTLKEETVMIKKTFNGFFKILKFYNEIKTLNKLKEIENIPKIHYIDYASLTIYMEYLNGICLRRTGDSEGFFNIAVEDIKKNFERLLQQIHKNNFILYDLDIDNALIKANKCYFIDFADAIYAKPLPKFYSNYLRNYDREKLTNNIFSRLDKETIE